MKYPKTSFRDWTKRFGTERECLEAVARVRWSEGFRCPRCGHDKAYVLKRHCIRQCASCAFQASPTAGTLFENTRLPLTKWFVAIYLATADKGGISAERLRKMIGVNWRTAQLMLDKIRNAMADRDKSYVSGDIKTDAVATPKLTQRR
ncbi:MAG: IS1595 family transposase, partial [Gammaproteobacteria bacterium]|nr:IS1595 family transposase [Gammaproteobacteria bacterium]